MPPTLDTIVPELLLDIAEYLPVRDLQALIRCNRLLYNLLLHSLYKQAVAFAPLTPEAHLHRGFMPNTWKNYPWLGNARQLALCLAAGLDKDMIIGSSGATLLHRTAFRAQIDTLDVMRLLLAHRAEVNVKDLIGMTPLHLVAESWYPLVEVSEPIQMLMQSGANIDAANKAGMVALHLAVRNSRASAVEHLLYHGADPNKVDCNGRAPLYYAMKSYGRDHELVTLLLEHGADLKTEDHRGASPLHYALHYDRSPKTVQLLLEHGADLNHANRNGRTPLYSAIKYCPEMVDLLLKAGANPNHVDSMAESLVHYAVHYAPQHWFALGVDTSPLALLLQHGADPNKVDHNSMTPLLWVSGFDTEKLQLLLKHGADPNIADDNGRTQLHYALSGTLRSCKLLMLLLDHGADPDKGDVDGKTALHYAVSSPKLVALLLERRADPNKGDVEGRTPLQYLLRDLNDSDDWKHKENEWMCESVRVLVNAGALVAKLGEAERELVKEICEPRTQHATMPAEVMSDPSLPSALDPSTYADLTHSGITLSNMPRDDDENGWQVVKYKQKQGKGKGKSKRKAKYNQGMKDWKATPTKKGGKVAERTNGRGKEREEKEGKDETMMQDGEMGKSDQERRLTWAEVAGRINVRQ
jgi:ankyrin repeat protein